MARLTFGALRCVNTLFQLYIFAIQFEPATFEKELHVLVLALRDLIFNLLFFLVYACRLVAIGLGHTWRIVDGLDGLAERLGWVGLGWAGRQKTAGIMLYYLQYEGRRLACHLDTPIRIRTTRTRTRRVVAIKRCLNERRRSVQWTTFSFTMPAALRRLGEEAKLNADWVSIILFLF